MFINNILEEKFALDKLSRLQQQLLKLKEDIRQTENSISSYRINNGLCLGCGKNDCEYKNERCDLCGFVGCEHNCPCR